MKTHVTYLHQNRTFLSKIFLYMYHRMKRPHLKRQMWTVFVYSIVC